ncbi:helix-turn-helix domain-containing protein [Streptomyces alkaliphilus]|uniref:Helix-turn-helix domain-containing protein n=1 Tax=Streptomyces alkaliphilus TaxID=1472722 RepID=A0A7W3Y0T6_9ACTN|nr:helix-turn-helix transcriptional regulator [Streptomyces alkaliphilus]MBB0243597.1 helix-turn-helix domain-containing protein [Streptomyces alkaliphilus]
MPGGERRCPGCGCRLSRYNPDTSCASCARTAPAAPSPVSVVPDGVWQDPRVLDALRAGDFGRLSRRIRHLATLRQQDLADLTGLSQSFLSLLESGTRRLTNIDKVAAFLDGVSAPADLVAVHLPGRMPPTRLADSTDDSGATDPSLPWTAHRMVTALADAVEGPTMERRNFLTATGLALTAYIHHWSTAETEPLERAVAGARIPDSLLDHLQATTDHLRLMDASDGSGALADLGKAHLNVLLRLLRQGSYREATGRRLAAITADTAAQTGWFTFDSGHPVAAQRYLLGALRAAHAGADVRLGAGALSYLAIHGYSTGRPRDAVVAARAAREKIRHLDAPALHAMLLTRQARGHAKLGERQAALKALGQAAEHCSRGRSEHDPHWLYWMQDGEIHSQAGSCHLDLGEPAPALDSLVRAREAHNPAEARTRALIMSRASIAHIRNGDLEAGCTTAHDALTLAERLRSARLRDHLEDIAEELAPYRDTPPARDLTERVIATLPLTEGRT